MQIRHRSGCPLGAQNQATRTIEVVEAEWPLFERCLGEVSGHLSSKGLEMGPDHLNDCRPISRHTWELRERLILCTQLRASCVPDFV
jgi:hypothetical protein